MARDRRPPRPRLILLRHGAVASHDGDIPLTEEGVAEAERVGRRLAGFHAGRITLLVGPTRRARETGEGIARGLTSAASPVVSGPVVASALRNPDLYLAGHRVDMVSTATAIAGQVPGVTPGDVAGLPFFTGFLASGDRIGYWLHHPRPPGEGAAAVAERIRQFAASVGDASAPDLVVAVTHSPVLRALGLEFLGTDLGEPGYLHGYVVQVAAEGSLDLCPVTPELTSSTKDGHAHGGREGGR